jgi:hypothetical protein
MEEKDLRQKDTISIEFNQELLEEWTKIYFKKHPRAKNKPINSPVHESLNIWTIMRRPMANSLKQKWKDFGKFVIEKNGLLDLGIKKCKCKYIAHKSYVNSKRRMDCDNIVPKFILDSLTSECTGVLVDDSCDCIEELTIKIIQEKNIKDYSEIILYDCEYDKELMFKTREIELNKIRKKEQTMAEKKTKKKTVSKSKKVK